MLRLRTFGGLAVDRRGVPAAESAGQHKALALLALVASSGSRGASRDQLAAWLWPESDADRARGALSQTVYTLRKQLGEPDLFEGTRTLKLNSRAIECDRLDFEAALERGDADAAVALYVGPFLDGFFVTGSAALDRWIDEQRADLARRAHGAMESLARAAAERGDLAGSAEWWRRLAALEPGNSRVAAALVSALGDAGDPGGALQAARSHEEYLRREFDAPPDPVVSELEREIRQRTDPGDRVGARVDRLLTHAARPSPPSPSHVAPPVGGNERGTAQQGGVKRQALLIAVLAVAGLAGAIAFRGAQRTAPSASAGIAERRILVTGIDNETGDTSMARIGRVATDWLIQGLVQTQMVHVMAPGIHEGKLPAIADTTLRGSPALIVRGSYTKAGDSVVMQAEVVDVRTGRVVRVVGPVSGPLSEPLVAVEGLRRHLTGALATLVDRRLSQWTDAASQPTSFEAYRAFQEGLDAFFSDTDTTGQAAKLLVHANALDSTFTLPLLWAIYAFHNSDATGDSARADSVLRVLVARRERMPPFDRALLDGLAAMRRNDAAGEYEAFRRVVAIAPNSEWLYKLGYAAAMLRRYAEADSLFSAIDPDAGWMRDWVPLSFFLPELHYRVGRHQESIDAARRLAAGRNDWDYVYETGRGLAALGRDQDVLTFVDAELARREKRMDFNTLFMVLSAARLHGHVPLARAMVQRALRLPPSGKALGPDSVITRERYTLLVLEHAELWDQAERSAKRLLHLDSTSNRHDALPYMVLLQAALRRTPVGDTAGLEARAIDEAARSDWQAGNLWMMDTPLTVKAELAAIRHDARMAAAMLDQEHGAIYALTERPAFDPIRGDPSLPWLHNPAAERAATRTTVRQ
jgi:DNA-binding SARP family transcriptional activator/tetratricopeptide (TPR) repeat protein